jgi:hypothetical protein
MADHAAARLEDNVERLKTQCTGSGAAPKNRVATMSTKEHLWHFISTVVADQTTCCVSDFYFSPQSAEGGDYFGVTSFCGRIEQRMSALLLRAEADLRIAVHAVFLTGALQTSHYHDKSGKD